MKLMFWVQKFRTINSQSFEYSEFGGGGEAWQIEMV